MHYYRVTILCIATYLKGHEFLRECKRQGCRVFLLTEEKLRDADWPRESVDEFYYIRREMSDDDLRKGIAHVARTEQIDRIVALDDFDVELGAMLREYLRVPGIGMTTARAFRDKLAMRTRARGAGIACPEFVHVLNDRTIGEWTARVPAPWVLKPRSQAAAIGIRKIQSADELWSTIASQTRGLELLTAVQDIGALFRSRIMLGCEVLIGDALSIGLSTALRTNGLSARRR